MHDVHVDLSVLTNPVSPSADPTIDDTTPEVGQTLTAATGAGTARRPWPTSGWRRHPGPGRHLCVVRPVPGDLGKRMTLTVTGTRRGYVTVSRTSAQTFPVAKGRFAKPPKPKIKGAAEVGKRLRVVTGAWPDGVQLKIQWYADGERIRGATGKKLLLAQSLRGKRISVKVTGTKQGYRPSKATSTHTAVVV